MMLLSPVFFAILQQCVSISGGSVRAHIRVPSSHGTGRDVILEKESEIQNHTNLLKGPSKVQDIHFAFL